MKHTRGTAQATRFLTEDGKDIESVADVIEAMRVSALKSDIAELYGVTMEGEDKVVCYTGNGPTSRANASFIAMVWNCHDELLAACEEIVTLSKGWDDEGSTGPKEPYSWESVGRLALDIARHAAQKARGNAT